MRITNKMMINNAKYWLTKQAERLSEAAAVNASGKSVNRPSDNPEAAAAILQFRSDISRCTQYEKNLTDADTLIEAGETTLDSVDDLLDQALDIVTELSNGKNDYTGTYKSSLTGLYDSIIGLANTTCSGTYLYGGNNTTSASFSNETSVHSGTADDIGFYLSSDADATIEICDISGSVVRTLTVTGSEGANEISWDGLDDSGTALSDGTYNYTVTAVDSDGDAVGASSYYYRGDSESREIIIGDGTTVSINSDGEAIFNDALMALARVIASFETDTTAEAAGDVMDLLNSAIDTVSYERVALSNIYSQVDTSRENVENLSTIFEEKLSEIENGNTAEAAVELTAQETAYEIATEAAAKILKLPKLSDYI